MAPPLNINRRRFLGSVAVGTASIGTDLGPTRPAEKSERSVSSRYDSWNFGLITVWRACAAQAYNIKTHLAAGEELRACGFGISEVRGRYIEQFGLPSAGVEHRGWQVTSHAEDSGNLKGHLRKIGRKYEQPMVIVKGYYRPATLHALTDLPALGLKGTETKDLGRFRYECLGAYFTLLICGQNDPPPVAFADLLADSSRIDWLGGKWEEIGLWCPRTFLNGSVWTTFDDSGEQVTTYGGVRPRPGQPYAGERFTS